MNFHITYCEAELLLPIISYLGSYLLSSRYEGYMYCLTENISFLLDKNIGILPLCCGKRRSKDMAAHYCIHPHLQ